MGNEAGGADHGETGPAFDVVFALQVIEHFENPENFLAEVSRVLRSGGLFLMAAPNTKGLGARLRGDALQGIREDHISLRDPASWQATLSEAGFERLFPIGLPILGTRQFALFTSLSGPSGRRRLVSLKSGRELY